MSGLKTMDIRVRSARWRDLRSLARIQRASFRPGLAYGMMALITLKTLPGTVFLVARAQSGHTLGSVIGDTHAGNSRIMNIAVHPEHRRQGIATALLTAAEDLLPTGNVILMAEEWNTGAQALYLREGYERTGIARDYYGLGRHGVWMRKLRTQHAETTIRV